MKSVIKIHTRDKWSWLIIPIIILFSSFTVNFIISSTFVTTDVYTGGASSIFIYMFVLGILVMAQTFPYALGMSVRRKDYFIGTSLMGLISSLILGVMIYLLAQIEAYTNGWGSRLHFFHFPYLNDGNLLEQLMIYISLLLCLFFAGFMISCFFRRFGGKGMFILAILGLLAGSIAILLMNYYGAWVPAFEWVIKHTAVQLAYWLIPFILIYLAVSYLLIRRATI